MDSPESATPEPLEPSPKPRLHRGVLTAAAAVAMVLAGLGVAGAQTGETPTTTKAEEPAATAEGDIEAAKEPGCHEGHGGPGRKPKLEAAAEAIGISREDLVTALRDGQSIAQVAQSKDVDPQKVVEAMVNEAKEHLAEAVEDGRLTQALADEKTANLTERITELVNREGLSKHRHVHRHFHRRGDREGDPAPANA